MHLHLNNYKNIIFDLGGVLLNIDYNLTAAAFQELGLNNPDHFYSKSTQKKMFDEFEKGKISADEFREELKKYLRSGITSSEIDVAWNAMLLDFPKERVQLLEKIKQSHRSFLLSNTNEIHFDAIAPYLQKTFGKPDLESYFEKVYLSYKINLRKPDAEIFKLVLDENDLKPEETLFIDDSPQHIEGAKKLGIHTYWLEVEKESILDVLG